jgi:hypothetical protein
MVLIAPEVDGAMFGFGIMVYSNGVRKMRLMRREIFVTFSICASLVLSTLGRYLILRCVCRTVGARRGYGVGGCHRQYDEPAVLLRREEAEGKADGAATAKCRHPPKCAHLVFHNKSPRNPCIN